MIREQREKVGAIDEELNEIRRRLDRLWVAVETTELENPQLFPGVVPRCRCLRIGRQRGRPRILYRQGLKGGALPGSGHPFCSIPLQTDLD